MTTYAEHLATLPPEQQRFELPLRTLLETPTIADMALVIAHHQAKQLDADTITQLLAEVEALADESSQSG